jgi:hypothetical protein
MANFQSLFPKAVNVLGEKKDPERNLWRNVLIVALEDAIGKGWTNVKEHVHIFWNQTETLRWYANTQVLTMNTYV